MHSLGVISNWKAILPIIVLFIMAISSFCTWHSPRIQRQIAIVGTGLLFYTSLSLLITTLKEGPLITYLSNWDAPYGIILMVDTLSAIMLVLTSLIGFCVAIFSVADIRLQEIRQGFYPAFSILLLGLCGGFLTGDLFNLYVWFEVTIISSFIMLVCGNQKHQLSATVKYVVLNLIATLLLLSAIALMYGLTGTLNMANISQRLSNIHHDGIVTAVSLLLLIAFGIKAGLFPLFFWLPASYHTPTFSSSALFAGLLTKLGVYAMFRVMLMILCVQTPYLQHILLVAALLTLMTGVLGALASTSSSPNNLRRTLSFTLISHVGFMILGLSLNTTLAITGGLFYLIQNVLVKVNLFFISGALQYTQQHTRLLSILFFVLALALSGIPPLSGFWGEWMLLTAAIQQHAYISVTIMLVTSILTLWVMIRLWFIHFPQPTKTTHIFTEHSQKQNDSLIYIFIPVILLFFGTLIISAYPQPLLSFCHFTANQLLNPAQYTHLIIGENP